MLRPPIDHSIETVDRKQLPEVEFSHDDVLADDVAAQKLRRAEASARPCWPMRTRPRPLFFFRTADGHTKRVRTHVLGAHAEYLTLRDGMSLPLRAVLGFEV